LHSLKTQVVFYNGKVAAESNRCRFIAILHTALRVFHLTIQKKSQHITNHAPQRCHAYTGGAETVRTLTKTYDKSALKGSQNFLKNGNSSKTALSETRGPIFIIDIFVGISVY
jgi:hypothetical protein